ncbi:non-ribosomal peptide synthetase [Thalassomonas haliotis]|uniref:Amino acid adenylation domain-containing protein n=1 Tax=Thalassomonas haliotis TaxID=485448 RepID=A0ABY7VGM6_9GAMM|nr:non-ribosomal peptide synthetase [Thalassomonas haliotis]WDE12576.1 amino acid adenylation domain-containing protein [Thalassomonas haliotis]
MTNQLTKPLDKQLKQLSKNIESIYPLAPVQQGMLFHTLMHPGTGMYLQQYQHVMVMDDLDLEAFEKAWQAVVDRHPLLRTAFVHETQQRPLQVVMKSAKLPFEYLDFSHLAATEQKNQIAQLLGDERQTGLPFNQAPMMLIRLIKLSDNRYHFIRSYHHILMDAWCFGIVMSDYLSFYRHYTKGTVLKLEQPARYEDYIAYLEQQDPQTQQDFWQQTLAGFTAPTSLGISQKGKFKDPQADLSRDIITRLTREQSSSLVQIASDFEITLNTLLQGAWAQTLAYYSNRQDLVFGVTVAGRSLALPGIESIVGLFINTLPLRCRLQPENNLREWLRGLQQDNLVMRENEQVSLSQIQQWSEIEHQDLFESIFVYENANMYKSLSQEALEFEVESAENRSNLNYPLTVTVLPAEEIQLELTYATADFAAGDVEKMLAYFKSLLLNIIALEQPQQANLAAVIPEPAANLCLAGKQLPADINACQRFAEQVEKQGDADAVVCENGRLSYVQLDTRSNALAHYLKTEHKVGADTLVGLFVDRSVDMVVAMLAILKAGGAYVPLDPTFPLARLDYMVKDAGLDILLTQEHLNGHALFEHHSGIALDSQAFEQTLAQYRELPPLTLNINPEDLAYVIYTSGTTGNPKGVMVEHGQLSHFLVNVRERYQISSKDKVMQFSTINFDISVEECFGALCFGAALVLRDALCISDPGHFYDFCARHDISVVSLPTAFWHQLSVFPIEHLPASLRLVIVGGEALQAERVKSWFNRYQQVQLINTYGPTEATVTASGYAIRAENAGNDDFPIGDANTNTRLYVLNESLQPVAPGTIGELYIGGGGIARGYLNQDKLTRESFIPCPFNNREDNKGKTDRLYRSGDLVRCNSENQLEFMGRIDDQVKIRGFRIEVTEIENVLQQHNAIKQAVVTTYNTGKGDKALVAYLVADQELAFEDIRHFLSQQLADYMIPSVFQQLEYLPLTGNGKLDKKALPAIDKNTATQDNTFIAPATPLELKLAACWQQVLGLEKVGSRDNFFHLGGHSLLVIQLLAALRREDIITDATQIFKTPALADLAAAIENNQKQTPAFDTAAASQIPLGCKKIIPQMLDLVKLDQQQITGLSQRITDGDANIEDIYPLAPLQQGILFHHMLDPQNDPYVVTAQLELADGQAFNRFVDGLQFVINRHPALRTSIQWRKLKQPLQVVSRQAKLNVAWLELPGRGDISARMKHYRQTTVFSLDLELAPLLEIKVAKDKDSDKHAVLFIEHHIISDHVGVEIIIKELAQYLNGQAESLPEAVPYRHFVARALTQNTDTQAQDYFTKTLADVDFATTPFALSDIQDNSAGFNELSQPLAPALSAQLRQCARQLSVSPAALFHAAWALTVAHTSARADIVFGTVMSGRMQNIEDAGAMLGMFINTLPLRLKLSQLSAKALVEQVQEQLQALLPHEQASLALAQRCSALPAQQALFSALLNYRHSGEIQSVENSAAFNDMQILEVKERSNYPCNLSVDDLGQEFTLNIEVSSQVPAAQLLSYTQAALEQLVEQLMSKQQSPILETYLHRVNQQETDNSWLALSPIQLDGDRQESIITSAASGQVSEAPQSETELILAEIWQEVLGLESLGRNDNFFELGGHSLLVMQVITALQLKDISLTAGQLFKHPNLAELALQIAPAGTQKTPGFSAPENAIPADSGVITPQMLPLIDLSEEDIEKVVAKVPGGAVNIQDIYPLAPLQQGILFHHMMDPQNDPYVMPAYLKITGTDSFNRFIRGLNQVIARHDTLRTAVLWRDMPQPVQVVYRSAELPVNHITLPGDEHEDLLSRFKAYDQEQALAVNIEQGPLLSLTVAHDNRADEYLIRLLDHHVISDHVTMDIIQQELALIFAEQQEQLPEPVQYREFVAFARHQEQQTDNAAREFFSKQLGDISETCAPFDLVNVQGDGGKIDEQEQKLPPHLSARLREQALRLKISPAALFHSAYAMVIAACSGQKDIVFGTVMSGRLQGVEGAASMMGMFINTLPLRISLANNSAEDLVRQTHEALRQLLPHEQVSLPFAQSCSGINGDAPLFTSILNYRHTRKGQQDGAHHALANLKFIDPIERTNYPFSVAVDDYGQDFLVNIQVEAQIDAGRILDYMLTALTRLSELLADNNPDGINQYPVLPEKEQHSLFALNATAQDYPDDKCIYDLFEAQVAKTPDSTALIFEGQQLSYRQLEQRANQLARQLLASGAKPETLIALYMERSIEMLVAVWGVLKAGAAYVPLDPQLPPSRIAVILGDSQPLAIISQQHLAGSLNGLTEIPVLAIDETAVAAGLAALSPDSIARPGGQSPLSCAYVIYTSGSTGVPKGVVCTHQGLVNQADAKQKQYPLTTQDKVLQKTPYSFDVSLQELIWPLISGACLVIAKPQGHKDPKYLESVIKEQQITTLHFVPSMLNLMLAGSNWQECTSVKRVFCCGEAVSKALETSFFATGTRAELHNLYGPTEAAIDVSHWACAPDSALNTVPIGHAMQNTQLLVLNESMQLVPFGVTGELHIGGVGLARGYLNREALTAKQFVDNPFPELATNRLYKTGDLVRYLPDGSLEYLGRSDHQVKIRGLRIELGEIEHQLKQLPEIDSALVVAHTDQKGEQHLVAYFIGESGSKNSTELIPGLQQQLGQVLPDYMIPAIFISQQSWPLTVSGKINRNALPKPEFNASAEFKKADTPEQLALAAIWADLLALETQEISVSANFFELGGHSLLAMKLISRIEAEFNTSLSLQALFKSPTIATIAEQLTPTQEQDESLDFMDQLLNDFEV